MIQPKHSTSFLFQHEDQTPVLDKLRHTVRSLTHARRRQLVADYLCKGLFCGILAACLLVLAVRLNVIATPYPIVMLIISAIAVTVLITLLLAWQRRPTELQVAILADLKLNLKQQLSTAWEFAHKQSKADKLSDPALVERLAFQAIRSRVPTRADRVFPPSLNNWAKLTPVAGGLLLLLLVFDPAQVSDTLSASIDALVVNQGVQLRDYGRQMQSRAERQSLPRSEQQAQQMQQLGKRMESGYLSRQQALNQLRELATALEQQRQAALTGHANETIVTAVDSEQLQSLTSQAAVNQASLSATLDNLINGATEAANIQFSAGDAAALARHGITLEDLQNAVNNLVAGDDQNLREILQTLAQTAPATNEYDAQVLEQAQQELSQIRETLGDSSIAAANPAITEVFPGADSANSADEFSGQFGSHMMPAFPESDGRSATGLGFGYGSQGSQQNPSLMQSETSTNDIVLKPDSQLNEGKVFSSTVQVLPRNNQPQLDTTAVDTEYANQLEAVLTKEHYPLHQKELIRRYFLTLSTGHGDSNSNVKNTAAEQ